MAQEAYWMFKGYLIPAMQDWIGWIKEEENSLHEYIAIYVDDLASVVKNQKETTDIFEGKLCFKLKRTGNIKYHQGRDFFRGGTGTQYYLL